MIPDNFSMLCHLAYGDSTIYLHIAKSWRKYELLKHNPKVAFSLCLYSKPFFERHDDSHVVFLFCVCGGAVLRGGGLGGEKADFNAPNAELKNLQMNMKSGQFISKERDAFVGKILVESLSAKV